jgi:hypothetical protein
LIASHARDGSETQRSATVSQDGQEESMQKDDPLDALCDAIRGLSQVTALDALNALLRDNVLNFRETCECNSAINRLRDVLVKKRDAIAKR